MKWVSEGYNVSLSNKESGQSLCSQHKCHGWTVIDKQAILDDSCKNMEIEQAVCGLGFTLVLLKDHFRNSILHHLVTQLINKAFVDVDFVFASLHCNQEGNERPSKRRKT